MIFQKQLLAAVFVLAAMFPATSMAKIVVQPKVYVFGFAASFNDTIVHFTDIQALDSVWMETKGNFLLGRANYSNMLRNYLTEQGMPNRTCIVIFDKKLKRLQKKFLKMKKMYSTNGKKAESNNDIRTIAASDFQFTTVDMSYLVEEQVAQQQPTKKDKKKDKKEKKKDKKKDKK